MKHEWTDLEFADWTLLPSEAALLANKTGPTRLGFAVLLKFFQYRGHRRICSKSYAKGSGMIARLDVAVDRRRRVRPGVASGPLWATCCH